MSAEKTLPAPYPEPTAEQRRFVIFLDPKSGPNAHEANDYRVQLIPGRMEVVDSANRFGIAGKIEEKLLDGWGYTYYVVTLADVYGTLMMPTGKDAEKKPRFIPLQTDDLYPYNSKLPIVVYMPKNGELRYRIWSVDRSSSGSNQEDSWGIVALEM